MGRIPEQLARVYYPPVLLLPLTDLVHCSSYLVAAVLLLHQQWRAVSVYVVAVGEDVRAVGVVVAVMDDGCVAELVGASGVAAVAVEAAAVVFAAAIVACVDAAVAAGP